MSWLHVVKIVILAIIQGMAELLPVSSSAHVIVAEKLLGLDPSKPEMTLLLVMLHTGTMFAVILYFWRAWKTSIFASREIFKQQMIRIIAATALTAVVGGPLILGIEHAAGKFGWFVEDAGRRVSKNQVDPGDEFDSKAKAKPKVDVEMLSRNLGIVAAGLAAAGVLILVAGWAERAAPRSRPIGIREAAWIGAVQGLCLPFRGFSRSGATISIGLLLGGLKARVEEFSFALAVIITPAAIGREVWRLVKHHHEAGNSGVTWNLFAPSVLGMILRLSGRAVGPALALPLARSRPLVFLRNLLPVGRLDRLRSPLLGILIAAPFHRPSECAIIEDSPPGHRPTVGFLHIT